MKRVIVVGEVNPDLVMSGYRNRALPGTEVLVEDATLVLGGASANCAVALARLGNQVAFVSKVGADLWGDFCLGAMGREGIDVSRVTRDPRLKTGITVSLTSPRDRALITHLGSIAALRAGDVPPDAFEGFDHMHVSSYFLQGGLRPGLRALFAAARERGLSTSLNPGFDPSELWGADLLDTLSEVDLFLPDELVLLAMAGDEALDSALRRLSQGRTRIVVKLGVEGFATVEAGKVMRRAAFEMDAADITGADASFDAGFLDAWLAGRPLVECLRRAAAAGALSTRGKGATAAHATAAEVEDFLRQAG